MRLAHVLRQYRIIVPKFSYHVEWLNVFSIVVRDALKTRDLPDRANGCTAYLPSSFSNGIRHKTLAGVRMQEEEASHLVVSGSSDCRAFTSGYKFTLEDHYRKDMN